MRYSTASFKDFWSLENKYRSWLTVEHEVYQTQVRLKRIPGDHAQYLDENIEKISSNIDVEKILEIEKLRKHDVVAFLEWLEMETGGRTRFFHFGMTSSDLVDTAFAMRMVQALDILDAHATDLCRALDAHVKRHVGRVMMGRSHGMLAQPTTVTNFFSGHCHEMSRAQICMKQAASEFAYGKVSGPVGSFLNIDVDVEEEALGLLNLTPEPVSTQVIPRDRHLAVMFSIARFATAIERLATNIRHLHRSEVAEIREGFAEGQKGSSSMPHKTNPIACESLCGLARYLRGLLTPCFENVPLWHERDISHSSVERLVFPEATTYLAYMLETATGVVKNLHVDHAIMKARVDNHQEWMSESLMLMLIRKGWERRMAHSFIQRVIGSIDLRSIVITETPITGSEFDSIRDYGKLMENSERLVRRSQ